MSADGVPLYAGLVTRGVAFVIDAAIVNVIAVAAAGSVSLVLSMFDASLADLPTWAKVVFGAGGWLVLNVVWFVGAWTLTGQTAGMRVMRIRVERQSGGLLPVWRGVVRLVGLVLAAVPLFAGYLVILVNDRRRGLQDWLAGSVVVFAHDHGPWGGRLQRRLARERQRLQPGVADGDERRLLPSPRENYAANRRRLSPRRDHTRDG
jgi:uncharacterized RDD family membrane protein YckC